MWNGERLLAIRNGRGMSRELLAQKIGIHPGTIVNYERTGTDPKRRIPDVDTVVKMARAMNVTVASLMGEGDPLSGHFDEPGVARIKLTDEATKNATPEEIEMMLEIARLELLKYRRTKSGNS